jgi:hypothetical protein
MNDNIYDKNDSQCRVKKVFLERLFEFQRVYYPKYKKQQIDK